MFGSSLLHSLMICGKKEFSKYSFYKEIHGITICGSKLWIIDGCPVERNLK